MKHPGLHAQNYILLHIPTRTYLLMVQITKSNKNKYNKITRLKYFASLVGYLREERIFIKNPAQITIKHFSTGFKMRTINLRAVIEGIFHPAAGAAAPASVINTVVAVAITPPEPQPEWPT